MGNKALPSRKVLDRHDTGRVGEYQALNKDLAHPTKSNPPKAPPSQRASGMENSGSNGPSAYMPAKGS